MITIEEIRVFALNLPETEEHPHFEKTSFRVNKKIFATIDKKMSTLVLKLTLNEQSVFCAFDQSIIYPVPGKWGKAGWTMIAIKKIKKTMCKDAIKVAYCTTAPKRLVAKCMMDEQ